MITFKIKKGPLQMVVHRRSTVSVMNAENFRKTYRTNIRYLNVVNEKYSCDRILPIRLYKYNSGKYTQTKFLLW